MRPITVVLLLWLTGPLSAQQGSVASLLGSFRSALRRGASDPEIARTVAQEKLSEKLEDAVVEELQSEGAGPETLSALDRQQELSAHLAPPKPLPLFDAPPAPGAAERSQILDKTREIALQYTAMLPNFLCIETVHRFTRGKNSEEWKPVDILTLDLAYSEKGEQYRLAMIDGRVTRKNSSDVSGMMSNGEFGSLLKITFEPKAAAAFQWERWTRLRGRLTSVFFYRIDRKHSEYTINWKTALHRYNGIYAMSGLVYIDRETGQVMRLTYQAEGIPSSWPILATPGAVDYEYAEISGQKYLLPRHVDSRVVMKSEQRRNRIDFENYRKFAAETNLTFDK